MTNVDSQTDALPGWARRELTSAYREAARYRMRLKQAELERHKLRRQLTEAQTRIKELTKEQA